MRCRWGGRRCGWCRRPGRSGRPIPGGAAAASSIRRPAGRSSGSRCVRRRGGGAGPGRACRPACPPRRQVGAAPRPVPGRQRGRVIRVGADVGAAAAGTAESRARRSETAPSTSSSSSRIISSGTSGAPAAARHTGRRRGLVAPPRLVGLRGCRAGGGGRLDGGRGAVRVGGGSGGGDERGRAVPAVEPVPPHAAFPAVAAKAGGPAASAAGGPAGGDQPGRAPRSRSGCGGPGRTRPTRPVVQAGLISSSDRAPPPKNLCLFE